MTIDREKLKSDILAQRGYWHPFHEGLLDMSPEFLRAYLDFQSAPWRSGHLEPKVREFIYIAIDGAVTHLYERGLRRHIEHALALGATRDEVMQVILLTTAAAAHHTHDVGMPILMEELARVSGASAVPALTAEQRRRKAAFIDAVGDWPEGRRRAARGGAGFRRRLSRLPVDRLDGGAARTKDQGIHRARGVRRADLPARSRHPRPHPARAATRRHQGRDQRGPAA